MSDNEKGYTVSCEKLEYYIAYYEYNEEYSAANALWALAKILGAPTDPSRVTEKVQAWRDLFALAESIKEYTSPARDAGLGSLTAQEERP